MKKFFLIFFIILAYNNGWSFIININNEPIRFGIKSGLNLSYLGGDDIEYFEKSSVLTNFQFGGIINYELSNYFTIQSEIGISFKGGKLIETTPEIHSGYIVKETSFEWQFSYLEIPVLLKYYFPIINNQIFKPYLDFGGGLGINLSSELELNEKGDYYDYGTLSFYPYESKVKLDYGEKTKNFETFIIIGFGSIVYRNFDISVRYSFGLTDLVKFDNRILELRNRVWTLMLNYYFDFNLFK